MDKKTSIKTLFENFIRHGTVAAVPNNYYIVGNDTKILFNIDKTKANITEAVTPIILRIETTAGKPIVFAAHSNRMRTKTYQDLKDAVLNEASLAYGWPTSHEFFSIEKDLTTIKLLDQNQGNIVLSSDYKKVFITQLPYGGTISYNDFVNKQYETLKQTLVLCEVPFEVSSVESAYQSLIPKEVRTSDSPAYNRFLNGVWIQDLTTPDIEEFLPSSEEIAMLYNKPRMTDYLVCFEVLGATLHEHGAPTSLNYNQIVSTTRNTSILGKMINKSAVVTFEERARAWEEQLAAISVKYSSHDKGIFSLQDLFLRSREDLPAQFYKKDGSCYMKGLLMDTVSEYSAPTVEVPLKNWHKLIAQKITRIQEF